MKLPAEAGEAGGQVSVSRRSWDDQLAEYVRFVEEQDRIPSPYGEDPGERRLAFWQRNQRSSLRNGLLLPERVVRLDQLLRAVQFTAGTGRWPSVEVLARQVVVLLELQHRTAQLNRAYAELEESNARLAGFAGRVSHDLRTPLTTMLGYVEMLRTTPEFALSRVPSMTWKRLMHAGDGCSECSKTS